MVVQKIAVRLLLSLAALVVAFAVGYDFGSDREKAKQISELTQAQADSNKEILKSQEESKAIEGRVGELTQKVKDISDKAVERVKANEPKVVTKVIERCSGDDSISNETGFSPVSETVVEVSRPWTFDYGTVRLLNSARTNDTDSAASISNVGDQTPTDITVSDFVENDLEVVALYHEQSERYKSLQDYIKSKQDEGYMFCKVER
ncbi:TPA: hypothetical protein U9M35_002911 [Acinetobacter baumannii]|nr:hypothetical protein [Acinetobacter baumannii]